MYCEDCVFAFDPIYNVFMMNDFLIETEDFTLDFRDERLEFLVYITVHKPFTIYKIDFYDFICCVSHELNLFLLPKYERSHECPYWFECENYDTQNILFEIFSLFQSVEPFSDSSDE
jgi:hypothetical protein